MIIHHGYQLCDCCVVLSSGMEGMTVCGLELYGDERVTLNKKKVTCKNCLRRLPPRQVKITRHVWFDGTVTRELRNAFGHIVRTADASDKNEIRYLRMAKRELEKHPQADARKVDKWITKFRLAA